MRNTFALVIALLLLPTTLLARQYEAPPSSSTYGSVPVISDEAMEYCVKIYNEAKWLGEAMQSQYVDQYSQASVDAYNAKVNKHGEMVNYFNNHCAGKQSRSAYEAAQRLNKNSQ